MVLHLTNPLLRLRSIAPADEELLYLIYSSTRTEELARVTDWTTEQKEQFLRGQFHAQHVHYQRNYTGAQFWMLESDNAVIGRLYIHPQFDHTSLRIIDITLLPAWRRQGIGEQILSDIQTAASAKGLGVTIHVERFNPAMKLYRKLGFEILDTTNGVYYLLQWKQKKPCLA